MWVPFKARCLVLFEKKIIDKWFFIRYTDPDNHLRIRFHLNDTESIGSVVLEFQKYIASFIETKQVWDIQLGTYKRELERYGKNTIADAETFFYRDSETVLGLIEQTIDDKYRFIYTLKYLEQIINTFNFSKHEELLFLERYKNQFQRESLQWVQTANRVSHDMFVLLKQLCLRSDLLHELKKKTHLFICW